MEEKKDHSNGLLSMQQKGEDENFPIGLKVLAIDANIVCLKYLVLLLRKCQYKVTATTEAAEAIRLLKDEKEAFDIVITDVIRLDMDGFKLLNTITDHAMDIPVVMISANDELEMVKRSVMEGAEAYLLKPVRLPEVRNIWQHVLRKRISKKSNFNIMVQKEDQKLNKKEENEIDETKNNENKNNINNVGSSLRSKKKPRVIWTKERHAKFVQAYEQLEEMERVPKKILKMMNEPELSRESIASHLQKHRDGLRKKILGGGGGVGKFVSQKNYYSSLKHQIRNKASNFSTANLRAEIPTSAQFQYPSIPSGLSSRSCYFPVPEFKWFNFPTDNNSSSMILKPCDQYLGFGSSNIISPLGGDRLNYSTTSQTFGNCPIDNVGATRWPFPNNATTTGQYSELQFDNGSSYGGGLTDEDISDIFRILSEGPNF